MRAIVINPTDRTVTEQDVDTSYEAFRKLVSRSGWIERVRMPTGHWLWVDEEGLLMPNPGPFFRITSIYPDSTFAGTGVILKEDFGGDHYPAEVDLITLQALVTFPNVRFVGFKDEETVTDHPVFGPTATFTRTAKFEDLP